MIPQRNLSLLSNRLARGGGRRIPESVLERDYCLAWFLFGLSRTNLREGLAFKGGTALKRCWFGDYRFSEDLDFTLVEESSLESILAKMEAAYRETHRASGISFRFSRADRKQHANSQTFYLAYEGPLSGTAPKEVKVDITIREELVRSLLDRPVLRGYEEYSDLPTDAVVRVYSLEEIAAEKIVALSDRARNEPRDLYDAWFLTTNGHVDLTELRPDIERKIVFRGRAMRTLQADFREKEARLRKLWSARLSAQMIDLPPYENVFRAVSRTLRESGLFGK
ncbi:nucleotidyl transferase AbiEii/AbiGii toxin family protein [bacterium]|nr:nucleotidyl transferase AbiEii/AbiGii toxin family protein [bacterium]